MEIWYLPAGQIDEQGRQQRNRCSATSPELAL